MEEALLAHRGGNEATRGEKETEVLLTVRIIYSRRDNKPNKVVCYKVPQYNQMTMRAVSSLILLLLLLHGIGIVHATNSTLNRAFAPRRRSLAFSVKASSKHPLDTLASLRGGDTDQEKCLVTSREVLVLTVESMLQGLKKADWTSFIHSGKGIKHLEALVLSFGWYVSQLDSNSERLEEICGGRGIVSKVDHNQSARMHQPNAGAGEKVAFFRYHRWANGTRAPGRPNAHQE